MSYQGNYPPSSPLTSSQIADGAVQPADLSAGGPSWNGSGGLIATAPFFENSQTISSNYTLTVGNNAMTAGPVTVNNGVVVEVPSGCTWTVI
jgi:hypothetical protein